MNLTEFAFYKKLFGGDGGGGKIGGTAIPVGEVVDRIYFNTNNTREETNALLSQLTYVEGIMEYPISLIYACVDENYEGDLIYAVKFQGTTYGEIYAIVYQLRLTGASTTLFGMVDGSAFENGWMKGSESYGTDGHSGAVGLQFMELWKNGQPLVDFMGVPIGTENEKIKNVLSITPF